MSEQIADALAGRLLDRHGASLVPYFRPGLSVLDCGCGPGSITCDIARAVQPGIVIGIDTSATQIEKALAHASSKGISNVLFQTASIYSLPFRDGIFDVVFAHAVFQHLSAPQLALKEISRVLTPGGLVALRSPDWGALLIAPRSSSLLSAIDRFLSVYYAEGDAHAGSNAVAHLNEAGYLKLNFTATIEHEMPSALGEFAASKLDVAGLAAPACALRSWAVNPNALFAQGWGEIVGQKPR